MPICGSSVLAYFYFRGYFPTQSENDIGSHPANAKPSLLVECRFRFFFLPTYLRVFGNIYFFRKVETHK